jgi:hypothetical protein
MVSPQGLKLPAAPLRRDLRIAPTRLVDELKSCRSSRVAAGKALACSVHATYGARVLSEVYHGRPALEDLPVLFY